MNEESLPQQTITRIKQLRANALLGKKKHFNAADRKENYQNAYGIAVVTINLVLGSGLIILLRADNAEVIKWTGAALSLIAALCAATQKYFGWQRLATGHRQIASRYLDLSHDCQNTLADFQDGNLAAAQLGKRRDAIQKALSRIDADAQSFPTSSADFALARQGMVDGEESYTEIDLQAGESR